MSLGQYGFTGNMDRLDKEVLMLELKEKWNSPHPCTSSDVLDQLALLITFVSLLAHNKQA